eukprot:5793445-Prymnesium_polylepis.1
MSHAHVHVSHAHVHVSHAYVHVSHAHVHVSLSYHAGLQVTRHASFHVGSHHACSLRAPRAAPRALALCARHAASLLFILQSIYPDEWLHLSERINYTRTRFGADPPETAATLHAASTKSISVASQASGRPSDAHSGGSRPSRAYAAVPPA